MSQHLPQPTDQVTTPSLHQFEELLDEIEDENNNDSDDDKQNENILQHIENDELATFDWMSYLDEIDKNNTMTSTKSTEYQFISQNHFVSRQGYKNETIKSQSLQLNTTTTTTDINITYYNCHQYLVHGYIQTNYKHKFIPTSIKIMIQQYLPNPFLFQLALDCMNRNKLTVSLLLFEAYLQFNIIDKMNMLNMVSDAWRFVGKMVTENENEKNGIIAFHNCINLNPNDLDALLSLGVGYINELENKKALYYLRLYLKQHKVYKKVFDDDDGDGKEDYDYDDEYDGYDKLLVLFKKALEINDKDVDLYVVCGILYNMKNEFVQSSIEIYKALKLKPDDASLWNKYGATKANNGNYQDAIIAYEQALQLKPNYVRVYANLGIAYSNSGKFDEAIKCYITSLLINPLADDDIWQNLQSSLVYLGKIELVPFCEKKDVESLKHHFNIDINVA